MTSYNKTMILRYENWLRTTTGLVKPKLTIVCSYDVLLFFELKAIYKNYLATKPLIPLKMAFRYLQVKNGAYF